MGGRTPATLVAEQGVRRDRATMARSGRYGGFRLPASPAVCEEVETDPRIPTLSTVTAKSVRLFRQDVAAYVAGTKDDEKHLCGPRVLRNLRGDARRHCEKIKPDDLVALK